MKLNHLTLMLYTADLRGTVDFYVEILGFSCIAFEAEWGWARVRLDGVELMFSQPNEHISFEKPGFTGSLYINTDDADAIWNRMKAKQPFAIRSKTLTTGCGSLPSTTTTAIYSNSGTTSRKSLC